MSDSALTLRVVYMLVLHYGTPRFVLKVNDGEPEVLDRDELVRKISVAASQVVAPGTTAVDIAVNGQHHNVRRAGTDGTLTLLTPTGESSTYATVRDLIEGLGKMIALDDASLRKGIILDVTATQRN